MKKITVSEINFRGRKALVRVDFNVPFDGDGKISDDRRIRGALPTILKILSDGGIAILCSHLGRPKGKMVESMSLKPIASRLSELLERLVLFADDCIGPEASNIVDRLKPGDCLLLENLRFHPGEEQNDKEFAQKLSSLADIFVNDAFGTAHRAHASTEGVTHFFNQSVAGKLMESELRFLGEYLNDPKRPFVAILGGAKISGKIDVIQNLLDKVDIIIIGGGMVFTFARAMGYETGDSLVEEDRIDMAREIIEQAKDSRANLIFPTDIVIASEISETSEREVVDIDKIPAGKKGLDIGPSSVELFSENLKNAKTVVWNGPMGVFECKPFATGTLAIANILAEITSKGAITIVGGGDSAAAVSEAGLDNKLTHISTGGGASLKFLEGKVLPGVAALTDQSSVKVV